MHNSADVAWTRLDPHDWVSLPTVSLSVSLARAPSLQLRLRDTDQRRYNCTREVRIKAHAIAFLPPHPLLNGGKSRKRKPVSFVREAGPQMSTATGSLLLSVATASMTAGQSGRPSFAGILVLAQHFRQEERGGRDAGRAWVRGRVQ